MNEANKSLMLIKTVFESNLKRSVIEINSSPIHCHHYSVRQNKTYTNLYNYG